MGWHPAAAMVAAGALGGLCGLALGLPSLRLPGFYFAMATMAFALIVGEIVLAQVGLTGGGVGLPGPVFPAPFDTPHGFYYLVAALAVLTTWLSWNVARRLWGIGPDVDPRQPGGGAGGRRAALSRQAHGVRLQRHHRRDRGRDVQQPAELHHARHLRLRAEPLLLRLHHHRRPRQHSSVRSSARSC
jgi:hypothetical protein